MSYQNPQGRIEGFDVTTHKARLAGWWDVSDDEDTQISLDRVVVMVVAARSESVVHKITDEGDVVSGRVLKISDAVPLSGRLREQAIQMLADHVDPNQASLSFPGPQAQPQVAATVQPQGPALTPSLVNSPPPGVDPLTGSIDDDEDDDEEVHVRASSGTSDVEANDDSVGAVGSVYPDGHVGKDKHLARFLGEDLA